MLITACWLRVFLNSVSLLIFHLDNPSIVEKELLKSPIAIVYLTISLFSSIRFYFTFFASMLFGIHTFRIDVCLVYIPSHWGLCEWSPHVSSGSIQTFSPYSLFVWFLFCDFLWVISGSKNQSQGKVENTQRWIKTKTQHYYRMQGKWC